MKSEKCMSEKFEVKDEIRLLNLQNGAQKSLPTEEGKARGIDCDEGAYLVM